MTRSPKLFFILCISLVLQGFFVSVNATAFQLVASKTEYKSILAGDWDVESEVVWSESEFVQEGETSQSQISITDIHGSLYPNWKAQGWKLVRNKKIEFKIDKTIYWERESKLVKNDEYWFVKSINKFKYSDDGTIRGRSYHKQYLNGEYVGSYITYSKLTKKEAEEFVASN